MASTADTDRRPVILVHGDSLSAGYGINPRQGWVELLQSTLNREGLNYRVVNSSVSGETTAGGLTRLPHALNTHSPQVVIIELGANDGLRGLPTKTMHQNLAQMIGLCKARGVSVLLVGMRLPPNYGAAYTNAFADTYVTLAREYQVALAPFLLDGIATDYSLLQSDGLHPTEQAQPQLLNNVWPYLQPLVTPKVTRQ